MMKRKVFVRGHYRGNTWVRAHYALIVVPVRVFAQKESSAHPKALVRAEQLYGPRIQGLLLERRRKGKLLDEFQYRVIIEGEGL